MKQIFLFLMVLVFVEPMFSDTPQDSLTSTRAVLQKSAGYEFEVKALYTDFNQPWGVLVYDYVNKFSQDKKPTFIVTERNAKVWLLQNDLIREIKGLPETVKQFKAGGAEKPGWFDIAQGSNGRLYLSYAKEKGKLDTLAVVSFRLDEVAMLDKTQRIIAKDVREIFESNYPSATSRHHGGVLAVKQFENYDEVYLALGSRANRIEAQNKSSHIGDVVRIRSDTLKLDIISYGHRNPQGLFYDANKDILYSTEHGPMGGDEFNIIEEGKNYGWAIISYGKEYGSGKQIGVGTHKRGMEQPVYYWEQSPALSGLIKYQGDEFPLWKDKMIAGALKLQQLYLLSLSEDGKKVIKEEQLLSSKFGRIRDITQDKKGYIYFITDSTKGKLYKISIK